MKEGRKLNRRVRWAAALLFLFSASSCSHAPDPLPSWGYQAGGISITCTADKLLNKVDEKPHAILLSFCQLSEPNPFSKMARYEAGLRKILDGRNVDPTVTAVQKHFIEPGESKTIVMDRVENTKWVGVVAGYYSLDPDKVSKVFEIPYLVESKGFISKTRVATVPVLHIDLILGPESIQEKRAK